MGRGIIFVGGNENTKEAIEYKKGSKWKDNWGMYSYHPSKVKSNKRKKKEKMVKILFLVSHIKVSEIKNQERKLVIVKLKSMLMNYIQQE